MSATITPEQREERIKACMAEGLSRDDAEFAVALSLGESDGDVVYDQE